MNTAIKKINLLTLSAFAIIYIMGCRDKTKDSYETVQVNKAFAKDPPIASHINISVLEKPTDLGNLLFEATLPKEKVGADALAFKMNDSNKVVLHDDGKNGDVTAGDGIFSTVLNVATDSLSTFLSSQLAEGKRLLANQKQVFQFKGRLELPANRGELDSSIFLLADRKLPTLLDTRFSLMPIINLHLLLPISEDFKHKSLMVTDPAVLNDPARTFDPCTNTGTPNGAWTFGKLMTELANQPLTGISPSQFALNWLNTWPTSPNVNGDVIAPRTISSILATWHALSGGTGAPLDINKAPFKLLAIVNRFDLRSGGAYGGGNAGEGRFVFCATGSACGPVPFFVIFEYGVNKTTCAAIHDYAQQWIHLSTLALGSPAYNTALQAITDQFTLAGTNVAKPNQSSLDQLRTNETVLASPWQLREFNLDPTTHSLMNVTVKREPQIPFNSQGASANIADVKAFGDFVNANAAAIIADKMDLPNTLPGAPTHFIAGKANTLNPTSFHWDAVVAAGPGHIVSDDARMHISLNACSGCHGGETVTGNFTQVGLPITAAGATLSPFLKGNPAFSSNPFVVADRANRPSATNPAQWPFNDLERRGRDLEDFVSTACLPFVRFPNFRERIPFIVPIELVKRLTFSPNLMSD